MSATQEKSLTERGVKYSCAFLARWAILAKDKDSLSIKCLHDNNITLLQVNIKSCLLVHISTCRVV